MPSIPFPCAPARRWAWAVCFLLSGLLLGMAPARGLAGPKADPVGRIALVFDDMGLNARLTARAIALPAPVTLAFLPYAPNLAAQLRRARSAGHQVIVHLPMQPISRYADPGPDALRVDMAPAHLRRLLVRTLDRFDGAVGVSNHMGSLFTADRTGMTVVLGVLRERGLFFFDSRTHHLSVVPEVARAVGLPFAVRDVFLDHDRSEAGIRAALAHLEALAQSEGLASGIAHPYPQTLRLLEPWLARMGSAGLALVPLSVAVRAQTDDCPDGIGPRRLTCGNRDAESVAAIPGQARLN